MKKLAPLLLCLLGLVMGCSEEPPDTPDKPVLPAAETTPSTGWKPDFNNGQALYVQTCLTCHQADGGGVPNMQPALVGTQVVLEDPDRLIEAVLLGVGGPAPALPSSGEYAMVMPAAAHLSDEEVADLLSYIRQAFNDAGAITPDRVEAVRARLE